MARITIYIQLLVSWSLHMWLLDAQDSIRFVPEQPVYLAGEGLTMRCVIHNPATILLYSFYKDGAQIRANQSSNVLSFPALSKSDSGEYFCTFYRESEKRFLEVGKIMLQILDPPLVASLIVNPQRKVFIKDQSAILTCRIPTGQPTTAVAIYQDGRQIFNNNSGILNLINIQQNSGKYSCGYTVNLQGRMVQSNPSGEVDILVIEPLPTPRLRYANGYQNQSGEAELTCDIRNTQSLPVLGYRLYRNDGEIQSNNQGTGNRFFLTQSFDGCYSCRVFVTILGQEILSPKSSEIFLPTEGRNGRQCEGENLTNVHALSKQGLKFYGSILAGKLLVLVAMLAIFGIRFLVIRQRLQNQNQKPETETQ
ncbi:uncharacterized protein [Hyperolius riggenbachi]|uniref:uncharacterized protein isoform X2 n=1 Tax=Hyperolius riggenbachi TaxID=752182 RepID=UPI0035A29C24